MSSPAPMRFSGAIAGAGSSSGIRVVVGRWLDTPLGSFADVMVEDRSGHRTLLAPSVDVADFIRATYAFDEVWIGPVTVEESATRWAARAGDLLDLRLEVGRRTPLGHLLRAVPHRVATSTRWASLVDPVASFAMRGVRTRGVALEGRREWYGATDLRRVTALTGSWRGEPLGALAPVDPPCRFGFSSTPATPSVTTVVTTVVLDPLSTSRSGEGRAHRRD